MPACLWPARCPPAACLPAACLLACLPACVLARLADKQDQGFQQMCKVLGGETRVRNESEYVLEC